MNTNRYDIFQSISQREDRALSEEDAKLVSVANDIIRAARNGRKDEAESGTGAVNVIDLNEIEQRTASTKTSLRRFLRKYLEIRKKVAIFAV